MVPLSVKIGISQFSPLITFQFALLTITISTVSTLLI